MGRPQYSSPEAEAIAQIDQSVQDIEVAVDELDVVVQELKDTDIANIATEIQNLDMWENYTKQVIDFDVNLNISSFTSVVSASGAPGMLKDIVLRVQEFSFMNLYIDGVLVIDNLDIINDSDTDRTNLPFDITYETSFDFQMKTSGGNQNATGYAIYGTE